MVGNIMMEEQPKQVAIKLRKPMYENVNAAINFFKTLTDHDITRKDESNILNGLWVVLKSDMSNSIGRIDFKNYKLNFDSSNQIEHNSYLSFNIFKTR